MTTRLEELEAKLAETEGELAALGGPGPFDDDRKDVRRRHLDQQKFRLLFDIRTAREVEERGRKMVAVNTTEPDFGGLAS